MHLVDYFADKVGSMNEFSEKKNPLLLYKTAISDFNESAEKEFRQGTTANQLIADRSSFIDSILKSAWGRFHWNENLTNWRKTRISLPVSYTHLTLPTKRIV